MNMRKWFGLMLVLMLAFVLAACGGDSDDDGGNSDGDNNSASSVDLPQTLTSESLVGGSFTVDYPEGWVSQDLGGAVFLANSQETLDLAMSSTSEAPSLESDTIVVLVTAIDNSATGGALTLESILNSSSLGDGSEGAESQEETLNGKSAASIVGTTGSEGALVRTFTIVVEVDGGFVSVNAITPEGETGFDDTVRAIAGSVEATFAAIDTGEETPAVDATEEPAG